MREYSKISPTLWGSKRFQSLTADAARFLFVYLLTCRHQNSAGCFYLPEGYACADLRGWRPEKYREHLAELVQANMVLHDEDCSEILIVDWFRHNGPMNPNHQAGTERQIENIQSPRLREKAVADLSAVATAVEAAKAAKAAKILIRQSRTPPPPNRFRDGQ